MTNCWKLLTSSLTAIPWGNRSYPTASRSASATTPPSTATSSASRPTSRSPYVLLQHGLQGFQGRRIHVPRADHLKPNRDFLAERYALFRRAS